MSDFPRDISVGGPPAHYGELLDDALYDYQRCVVGTDRIEFFQLSIGSDLDGKRRTREDTNMHFPGALPNGVNFMARSLEVTYIPFSDPNESNRKRAYLDMAASGELAVQVLDKRYHQGSPLGCFMRPWEIRLFKASEEQVVREAAPWTYGPMVWTLPVTILCVQQFAVEVKWQAGAPCNGRIGVVLHGIRQRPVA